MRYQVVITCEFCTWQAVHSGMNALELAHHVRDVLLEHVQREHPDKKAVVYYDEGK